MKISPYVCAHIKIMPWKFRILNPKNSRVIRPFVFFQKRRLLFNVLYYFSKFVNKHFAYLKCVVSKVKVVIMHNLRGTIFYMKINVLQDFHIFISVPLKLHVSFFTMQKKYISNIPTKLFKFPDLMKLFLILLTLPHLQLNQV